MILFLSPRVTPSSALIESAAHRSGWSVNRLSNWRAPEQFVGRTDLVAYGEPLFVAAMAQSYSLALIEPPFSWLVTLPERYRQRQVSLVELAEARLLEGPLFAKPADDKCFSAGVFSSGAEIGASDLLPKDIPVLVSEVVSFVVEYRFFILNRTVSAYSVYLRNGIVAEAPLEEDFDDSVESNNFINILLSDDSVAIPPAVVIDVGKLHDGTWVIVEANPLFGSGICHCEPDAVLPALARSLVPLNQLTEQDKAWVLTRREF